MQEHVLGPRLIGGGGVLQGVGDQVRRLRLEHDHRAIGTQPRVQARLLAQRTVAASAGVVQVVVRQNLHEHVRRPVARRPDVAGREAVSIRLECHREAVGRRNRRPSGIAVGGLLAIGPRAHPCDVGPVVVGDEDVHGVVGVVGHHVAGEAVEGDPAAVRESTGCRNEGPAASRHTSGWPCT